MCCETARSRVASTCVSRDNALAAGVSGSVRTAEPLGSVVRSWTVVFLFCACPAEHCTLLESPNFRIRRHLDSPNLHHIRRQRAGCGCAVCCETARSRVASTCVSRDNALAAGVSGSVRTAEPLGSVVRSWTVVFLFCACPAEHCTLLESPNFRIRRHLDSPNLHHIRRQRAGCGCAGNSTLSSRFDLRIRR